MLILCGYKKRVGKDTLFLFAKELFPNKKIVRIAFADPVKEELEELLLSKVGLTKDILDDPDKKDATRPLTQGWGTIRRLFFDVYWWIKKTLEKVTDDDTIYICTDARYFEEIDYSKKHYNAIAIKINRNIKNDDVHSSEIALDNYEEFDYIIDNNSTLEDYKKEVFKVMSKILKDE